MVFCLNKITTTAKKTASAITDERTGSMISLREKPLSYFAELHQSRGVFLSGYFRTDKGFEPFRMSCELVRNLTWAQTIH